MPEEPAVATDVSTSTPAPAPTPAAAPAPSESARPATALDAVRSAADRLSKATPPVATPDGQPPAEGVIPPVAAPAPASEPEGVRNLRTAYEAYKSKVGWAENHDPEEVKNALELITEMRADPVSFYRRLGTDLTGHPTYGKALQPPPAEAPEPGPDLFTTDEAGNRIEMYSAKRQREWREWNDKRVMGQVDQRLNPLQEWHRNAQSEEQRRTIIEGAKSTATEVMNDMRANYPYFTKENEPKIAEFLAKIPAATKKRIGSIAALNVAYTQFLKAEIFPNIDKRAEDRIRKEFGMKAAASSGSVKPGGGNVSGVPKRPTNVGELAKHLERLSTAGGA